MAHSGQKPATSAQLDYIRDLLERLNDPGVDLIEEYDVATLDDLTMEQASKAIDDLKVLLR